MSTLGTSGELGTLGTQGVILINLLAVGLIILILNLVRTHKLYVGYAVLWLVSVTGMMIIIAIPDLLEWVTLAIGARFPASAISLLAFVLIFLVLIFFSVKISILSDRQTKLIQNLAIKALIGREESGQAGDPTRNLSSQDSLDEY